MNLIHTLSSQFMEFKMYYFGGSQFGENNTYFFDKPDLKPKMIEITNPPIAQIPLSQLRKPADKANNFFSKLFHLKIEAFTIEQLVSL